MQHKQLNHYLIKNVTLWTSEQVTESACLLIKEGKLDKIFGRNDRLPSDKDLHVIEGDDHVLMPAGVDPQVHLRTPGQPEKETPATGMAAAIAGGYGAVLTMPNTKPVLDTVDAIEKTHKLFAVDPYHEFKVCLSAAISQQQKSKKSVDYRELAAASIHAFTDDGYGVHSDAIMEEAFAASEQLGLPILQHAETLMHGGVLAPSSVQEKLNLKPYPAAAESDMVERDLGILKRYPKAKYHVLHVSCRKSVELVEKAKAKGLKATCEVSPHHLYFSGDDIDPDNSSFKMNPPLRSKEDRAYLQEGLANGKIDFVATDHAPHEGSAKTESFKVAAYGTTGLETSLRVLISMLQAKKLTPQRLVEVFSTKGARFLGLDSSFGNIEVGQRFRGTLVDVNAKPRSVVVDDLYSQSKNNCFLGTKLPGKIEQVFLGESCFRP